MEMVHRDLGYVSAKGSNNLELFMRIVLYPIIVALILYEMCLCVKKKFKNSNCRMKKHKK